MSENKPEIDRDSLQTWEESREQAQKQYEAQINSGSGKGKGTQRKPFFRKK